MEVIKDIRTRKGANLNLKGGAEKILDKTVSPTNFAIRPDDFFGIAPKLILKEGASVKLGSPIFFSKKNPNIKFVSPVAGTITSVVRGPKRKIENIIIKASNKQDSIKYSVSGWDKKNRDDLKSLLTSSGNWSFIHQRPYGIIANPTDTPKAIFCIDCKNRPGAW